MPKTAILFTGQGAQSVGMGRSVAEASAQAAEVFERAGVILGFDIARLCFEGPAERLEQTNIQQPAIFVTSVAIWRALDDGRSLDEPSAAMAGLSLGEYTALHAAGSLTFDDALRLVHRRGQLMQQAAEAAPSGMVTALGLEPDQIDAICREAAADGVITPANFNCPGQIVVSGARAACDLAARLIEQAGGRAVPLKVAGAFHSPLMQSAADGLARVLADTPLRTPAIPVIANVDCQPHADPATMRRKLTDQVTHPIRWQASIERLIADGVERFVEIGPGRILTGLMKKIDRRMPVTNVATAADLAQVAGQTA